MTKAERAKARALTRCRLGPEPWARHYIAGLVWLAEHDPGAVLTASQKWALDSCVWRYRRQLAGQEGIELPDRAPVRADYLDAHEARCASRREALARKHGPKPEQDEMFPDE